MNTEFGYCRVATAVPVVRPDGIKENVQSVLKCAQEAAQSGVDVLVFPELSVTGYTCADLFYQEVLLDAAVQGLKALHQAFLRPAV